MSKSILAEDSKGGSSCIFRPDPKQLRQIIAGAVAAWVRTRGARRSRCLVIHLIEIMESDDAFQRTSPGPGRRHTPCS